MAFSGSPRGVRLNNKYVVAQLGARRSYAVPRILHAAGRLERFYTDAYSGSGALSLLRALPASLRRGALKRISERVASDLPSRYVKPFQLFGLQYARRCRSANVHQAYLWGAREFCRRVAEHGLGDARGVYTFNSAGLEILQAARARGMRTVVEQTIAPARIERRLMQEERAAFPDWEAAPHDGSSLDEFVEREESEWHFADTILCGSEFVRQGIAEIGGTRSVCQVVPYGIDAAYGEATERAVRRSGKLRVLTVGAVGLRKGSPYVLEAARRLASVAEFRMVGPARVSQRVGADLTSALALAGARPRSEVREHYRWADVFLLPSICEGSAESSYEALASGLPVIATPNAGTIVRDSIDGFIVGLRSVDEICTRLEQLATDRELLAALSASARQSSSSGTLESYAERLLASLPETLQGGSAQRMPAQ